LLFPHSFLLSTFYSSSTLIYHFFALLSRIMGINGAFLMILGKKKSTKLVERDMRRFWVDL